MVRHLKVCAMLCALVSLSACGTRTIIPSRGDPVQLREPIEAKVWVFDKDGKRVESEAILPVGWYVIDAPETKNE
jgi:hypothetical protein